MTFYNISHDFPSFPHICQAQEVKFGTSRKPQTLSFGPGGCIDSFHKLKKANMGAIFEGKSINSNLFLACIFLQNVWQCSFFFFKYHIICYVLLIMPVF